MTSDLEDTSRAHSLLAGFRQSGRHFDGIVVVVWLMLSLLEVLRKLSRRLEPHLAQLQIPKQKIRAWVLAIFSPRITFPKHFA